MVSIFVVIIVFFIDDINCLSLHRCSWFEDKNNYDIQLIEPKTNFMLYQFSDPYHIYIKDINKNNDDFNQSFKNDEILKPEIAYKILMKIVKLKCLI